jgi:hypothetical protein
MSAGLTFAINAILKIAVKVRAKLIIPPFTAPIQLESKNAAGIKFLLIAPKTGLSRHPIISRGSVF